LVHADIVSVLRANRTLLPVAPTGVAMPPRTVGFGNRDHFELNARFWWACVTQIQALLRWPCWSGGAFLGFRLWCMKAKQPRSARNADS
jgi:hypothetical protein